MRKISKNILPPLAILFGLFGCATPAVVFLSPDYGAHPVKRVALVGFADFPGLQGSGSTVADIFEKYLFNLHYQIVDPGQAPPAPQLDSATILSLGKSLGVDAVASGSISEYSETSEQTVMVDVPQEETDPVYQTVTVQGRRGLRTVTQQTGTQTTFTDQSVPETETLPARVGLSVRLVSVKNGELLWSGSGSADGMNLASAAENVSSKITQALLKDLEKHAPAAQ